MLEQGASASEAWSNFPFEWVMGLVLAFWLGLFVQDFFNRQSWIYKNWRLINQVFEIGAIHSAHIEEQPERAIVRVLLRFVREIKDGRIVVSVHPLYKNAHSFVVFDEKIGDCPRHSEKSLILCNVPIRKPGWTPIHAVWGEEIGSLDIKDGQKTIVPNSENIIEIVVKSRWREQSFRFLAKFTDPSRVAESHINLWWGNEHLGSV